MPNLRDMIDNKTIVAAGIAPPMPAPTAAPAAPPPGNAKPKFGKPPKGGSPMANHIANHMQDPLGATKEGYQNLTQKKLEYDQAREDMQRNLAPVKSVMDHVSQIHGIQPGAPAGQIPTPGMTPGQPQIDPMTGQPMAGGPGQDPNNPGQNDNPELDEFGNPVNMGQTTGKMNQNRPSMAGHQPGVAPGPQQSVVPGKMGMPRPGGMQQTNKPAAKPKGAGGMPGAKGPGDPKVAGKNNKAQSNSSRQIKIHVAASNAIGMINSTRIHEAQLGLDKLRCGGPGSGRHKGLLTDAGFKYQGSSRAQSGMALTNDAKQYNKDTYTAKLPNKDGVNLHHTVNVNTSTGAWQHEAHVHGGSQYQRGSGKDATSLQNYLSSGQHTNIPAKWSGKGKPSGEYNAAGTSSGAKKNWSVRNKGPISPKEKKAHYDTMDSMGGGIGVGKGGGAAVPSRMYAKKKIKAGPSQLSDKVSDPGTEVAYNAKYNASGVCMKCGKKKHIGACSTKMSAGGPGSGRRSGGETRTTSQMIDQQRQGKTSGERLGYKYPETRTTSQMIDDNRKG